MSSLKVNKQDISSINFPRREHCWHSKWRNCLCENQVLPISLHRWLGMECLSYKIIKEMDELLKIKILARIFLQPHYHTS